MSRQTKFSVIIPAYNEAARIRDTLSSTLLFFEGLEETFEVIVVDDGSTDETAEFGRQISAGDSRVAVLELGSNRGKGAAVRTGVLRSSGSLVLMTDADLATPYAELVKLRQALDQGYDIAIGSRGKQGAQLVKRQPLIRELAGKTGNLMIRVACPALWGIADTQCGFKLFRGEAARSLFGMQLLERFGFDVEILFLARRAGYRIAEIPVVWSHGEDSKVKPTDYLYTLLEITRIRLNSIAGKYKRSMAG